MVSAVLASVLLRFVWRRRYSGRCGPGAIPNSWGYACKHRRPGERGDTTSARRGTWAPERVLTTSSASRFARRRASEFFDEAAARLKRAVPFDGACWHTLDPGSDLITQHHLQDIPDRFPVLANNEYAVEDVNKFDQLARAERKAATLSETTGGHPERSARFRDLLTPAGLGPELRSAFVADGATWGALILVRRAGEPEFEERDVELLSERLGAVRARRPPRADRRGMRIGHRALPDAPGVIELDASRGANPRIVVSRAAACRALGRHGRGRRALGFDPRRRQRDQSRRSPRPAPRARRRFQARW